VIDSHVLLMKSLQEIDAGGNAAGEKDVVDFSAYDGAVTIANGRLTGTDIDVQLKNFEEVIGSKFNDTLNYGNSFVTRVDGGSGDDVIIGGKASAILLGGEGDDTLIAGSAGGVLDGGQSNGSIFDGGGNHYIGGAGADIFVIGNGADAKNGSSADFIISSAGADDRLVLRLDDALGFESPANWTKGIVLSGGVQAVAGGVSDPDQVSANFSSILVNPQTIETNSDGAWITETSLDVVKPELGFFEVSYEWDKPDSQLFVFVDSAYGSFNIRVDGFHDGDLGLTFVDASQPKLQAFHGDVSTAEIRDSWTPYHDALRSFVDGTQIINLPSPGDPIDGSAAPINAVCRYQLAAVPPLPVTNTGPANYALSSAAMTPRWTLCRR
jgi:hypothetical protein